MNAITVSMIGNEFLDFDKLPLYENAMKEQVRKLLLNNEYVVFLIDDDSMIANYGATAVRKCRQELGLQNACLKLALPYETDDYIKFGIYWENEYDEIEICGVRTRHLQVAHQLCSQSIVDRSDIIIAAIEHSHDDGYRRLQYALRSGKQVIHLLDS